MPERDRSPLIRTHLGIVVFVFSLKSSTNVKGCKKNSITRASMLQKGERRQGVTLIVTTESLVILNSNYFLNYNYKVSNYYRYYNRLCLTYCQ